MKYFKLNLLGKECPIPVLKITKKFLELKKGQIIIALVDDPKAENDVEELGKKINIKILEKKKIKNYLSIKIQKT